MATREQVERGIEAWHEVTINSPGGETVNERRYRFVEAILDAALAARPIEAGSVVERIDALLNPAAMGRDYYDSRPFLRGPEANKISALRDARDLLQDQAAAIAERDERIERLERERDEAVETTAAWKAEVSRIQNAHKADARLDNQMTLTDVIAWLKDHRWTHSDWASWFEQHPDDPRAVKGGVGTAEFHRKVEARYNSMIDCLTAAKACTERLQKALREIAEHPEKYDDGKRSYAVGWAFHNVQSIARAALQQEATNV